MVFSGICKNTKTFVRRPLTNGRLEKKTVRSRYLPLKYRTDFHKIYYSKNGRGRNTQYFHRRRKGSALMHAMFYACRNVSSDNRLRLNVLSAGDKL